VVRSLEPDRLQLGPNNAGASQNPLYIGGADTHPLCCDCSRCLNGDDHA
jgi:hypothetical protein